VRHSKIAPLMTLWVKTSKAQNEQMFSGLPPKAVIQLWLRAL
jgi:hypothetical protein